MNKRYREAVPRLQEVLPCLLEEVSGVDLYYTDGDRRVYNSFFKLVILRSNITTCVVYICEKSYWVSFGSLTEAETKSLDEWIKSIE